MENRYRVEVTIPVWIYMEDEYMQLLDVTTQETIMNKVAEDIEWGNVSFMDVKHWRVVKDNPTIVFDSDDDPWIDLDPDVPIDYVPTGKRHD